MKHCLILCLLLIGVRGTCFSQQDQSTDIKQLTHLREVEWPQAYREQDTTLLNRILAPEFQSIDATGVLSNKRKELLNIRKSKPTYSSFQFTLIRLDVFENGSAIMAGTCTVKGNSTQGSYVMTYQSSDFFIKRNNRWQAVGAHISGVNKVFND